MKKKIDPALFKGLFAQSTSDKKRENMLEQWADPNSSRSRKRAENLLWWQHCAYEANSANGWKATAGYGRKYIHLAFAANKAKGFAGPKINIKKAQATNKANGFELQRKVCIPKAQAANKANGYEASKRNLKFAIAARLKKNEIDRTRIVESLPELLPPQGLRCKALIHLIQETFLVSIGHARVCIKLAVNRNLIYKTPGFGPRGVTVRTVWRTGLVDREKIEAIKARIADEITPPFERNYKLLIAFYDEHKNWDIPHGKHNEESGWLWNRAHYMRHANANGLLNSEKNKRFKDGLTARNFAWGLTRAERHVDEILDFQARNKRWPTNSEYPYMKILRAVATGRESSEDITEELLNKLRCKGWSPGENPQALAIDQIIKRLEDHYEQTKSWDLSANKALGIEATYMRSLYSGKRKSKYWNQSHVDRLNAKKFPWVWSRIRAKAHAKDERVSEHLTGTGGTRVIRQVIGTRSTNVLQERLECDCGNREVWLEPAKANRRKTCGRKCPIEQAAMRLRVKKAAVLCPRDYRHRHLTATEETRSRLTNRGRTVLEQKFICDCGGEAWIQPSSLKDRTACSPGCSYAKAAVAKARTESAARRRALAVV
jgi:hypothetical protein